MMPSTCAISVGDRSSSGERHDLPVHQRQRVHGGDQPLAIPQARQTILGPFERIGDVGAASSGATASRAAGSLRDSPGWRDSER